MPKLRVLHAAVLVIVALAGLLIIAEEAEATANCGLPVADRCHGHTMVGTTTGGTLSGRCFNWMVSTTGAPGAPACTTGGVGTTTNRVYEMDAGACLTSYWYDVANGPVPPAIPNKVSLRVYFDTTATLVKTFVLNVVSPASPTAYTFCATSTGDAGGAARAGTHYFEIVAIKDNGNGLPGNTNYAVVSSGVGTQDTSFDAGGVRARTFVSDIARSAYTTGSTFAYGPAGDETITVTTTRTLDGGDNAVETAFNSILDEATLLVGQAAATVDVDGGSLAQGLTSDSTFPVANGPYVGAHTLVGNSVIFGERGTVYAATGHCATCVRVSDTFMYNSADFNIDPRIIFDSDGAGTFATADGLAVVKLTSSGGALTSVFNRGETYYAEWYLLNARSEKLSRAMTHTTEDAADVACTSHGSLTPTANKYSITVAIPTGGSCAVAATEAGSPRYLMASNTDQGSESSQVFAVSSLLFVDAHIQKDATLVPDDYPTEDAGEYFLYLIRSDGSGGDDSDTIYLWCGVQGVRKDVNIDTSGSAVVGNIKDPTTTTRDTATTDTGSDGWTPSPTTITILSTTPLGDDWTANCTATFAGNTGTDTETFEVNVEGGGGGGDNFMADPLKIYAVYDPVDGQIRAIVSASMLDGTARVGVPDLLNITVWDNEIGEVVSYANPIELGLGSYYYNYTPTTRGIFTVRANTTDPTSGDPIGTANDVLVHGNNTLELSTMTNFSGLGFDGFLILLLWIAAILFFSYMGWLVALAFAVPGLLDTVIPELPFDFTTYLLLCLLGFILEVAANKWSWGGYQSGKRRLRIGA